MWWQRLNKFFTSYSKADKELAATIQQIVGKFPIKLPLYKLALKHSSAPQPTNGFRESNERLEYLGDALLGAIVAEYLFKKYPFEEEGFLSEIRSRIVNREMLNEVAQKMGLDSLIQHDSSRRSYTTHRSMNGDALEALVGAIYLDQGFLFCQQFVLHRLLQNHYDLDQIITQNKNFKSTLIQWSQRENKALKFEVIKEVNNRKGYREFVVEIYVANQAIAQGQGLTKKKAEQAAAEKGCQIFGII